MVHADIDQTAGKTASSENLDELAAVLQRMSIEAKDGNANEDISEALKGVCLEPGSSPGQVSLDAVQAWCVVEDDSEMKEALAADAREDFVRERLGSSSMAEEDEGDQNSSEDEDNQTVQSVPRPRPAPLSDVAADFGRIEAVAQRGQMTEVLHLLRRAKLAWMRGAGSRKTKQSSIEEFL